MQTSIQASGPGAISAPPAIEIELLALDLSRCARCLGTLANIEKAIGLIRPVLELMELQVNLKKTVIDSEEQARRSHFATSPTVRVNGNDIAFETLESACDSCAGLCGCDEGITCRVWRYREQQYPEAPVGLIVDGILRENFGSKDETTPHTRFSGVPENLQRYFRSKVKVETAATSCCSPAEREFCCGQSQVFDCCAATSSECACH